MQNITEKTQSLRLADQYVQFHKPLITDDEISEVVDTLRSGWLSMGPKTLKFEEEFNSYIGSKRSVSVNSWTAAGHLVMEAIGLKPGDEVIVPTMTFPATAEIVCYFGAKPVILDVEKDTLNISPEAIEKAITPKTKAIIPVHFAGQPCDMDEILDIAERKNLRVMEDAAHALPSFYKGRKVGTIAETTCYSFYATKTLTTGEGGMICTKNDEIAERCKVMRLHGIDRDAWNRYSESGSWYYQVIAPGHKYNLTDLAAAIGLAQLPKLDRMNEDRKWIAEKYIDGFRNNELVETLTIRPDRITSWYLFPIRLILEGLTIDRNRFIEEMKMQGVGAGVHFLPVHRHKYYAETFNLSPNDYPVIEDVFPRLISLPIYPGMTDWQVDKVIDTVNHLTKFYKK